MSILGPLHLTKVLFLGRGNLFEVLALARDLTSNLPDIPLIPLFALLLADGYPHGLHQLMVPGSEVQIPPLPSIELELLHRFHDLLAVGRAGLRRPRPDDRHWARDCAKETVTTCNYDFYIIIRL